MAVHYSQFFRVKHEDFVAKGVYNACLDADSLLHIDPLLLKNSKIPEFANAYDEFLNYFSSLVPLVKHVQVENDSDRFFRSIIQKVTFKEIPNTGLGFSKGNTSGKGISGSLSRQLAHSACEIIKAGMCDPEIFALMQFIEDKIAADRISDMVIYILQKNFLQYTARISAEMNLPTKVYTYSYDEKYRVPYYRNKPIHFIPMEFLTELKVALSYEDIDDVCSYNNRLKKKVAEVIGLRWAEYKKYNKQDWRKLILSNRACYNAVIDCYKNLKGMSYDFNADRRDQYSDILLNELIETYPFEFSLLPELNPAEEIFAFTKAICQQFKHLVEDNRISEIVWRHGRKPDETDWQMLLYAVADTYKKAGNFDCSITREDNPGVGEIDFHLTRGAKANTIVEIKRSSNSELVHGYRTQLAAYMKAEKADSGLFMVIVEDDSYEKIAAKLEEVKADMIAHGEYIPEIIYINGCRQVSASKKEYKNPRLE